MKKGCMGKLAAAGLLILQVIFLSQCGKQSLNPPEDHPDEESETPSIQILHDYANKRFTTEHFYIHYPADDDTMVAYNIAEYSESVYNFVNDFFCGQAFTNRVGVYLTRERMNYYSFGGSKPEGIYLYIVNGSSMKQIFAHEVSHVVFWALTDKQNYNWDFINEGAGVMIETHYEEEINRIEPWPQRAFWAAHQGKIQKDALSNWNSKYADLGNIFYAVGYTFNLFFRLQYGAEKWVEFIKSLSGSNDLEMIFNWKGLNYDAFYCDWIAYLNEGYNTYSAELSKVPSINDSLIVESCDNTRDVKVAMTVDNGESQNYTVYISYYINNVHRESSYRSNNYYLEKTAVLGQYLTPGTEILYDIVVSSNILKSWIKSGWKEYTVE
jgi:hypothetical protein